MQERYLGDSHDFLKYAFLRHLSNAIDVPLGVNWYLSRPENVDRPGNNDGEKRHHLNGTDWQEVDSDLFDKISGFSDPAERHLDRVKKWGVLPEATLFHAENICSSDRKNWHANALAALDPCGLVFLDPDNGFEVPSMSRRTAPKYALYREAADYAKSGKVVVGIQFARQCDPIARAREVRDRLLSSCGGGARLPVVRGRVAPNILFVTFAPLQLVPIVKMAIETFCNRSPRIEIVE